ncbi:hypothetical protein N658DRAFT_569635 [Parathielavia hyrcaniae]|uniref:Uncharacterized protein n=1 Tax=Parathielavia hyrcaniae TaxID=113614 RepID=A0AAN6SXE5_9PEZI|nr:hypothetical protein N658DRAFT_569635 [Parathielavia hyrcaniae]
MPSSSSTCPPEHIQYKMHITQPEPGSLCSILLAHANTPFYFNKRTAIVKPVPDLAPGVRIDPTQTADTLISGLSTLTQGDKTPARACCSAMKHILSTLFPATLAYPETGVELNLYFGHSVFSKAVRIPCVWSRPTLPATSFSQVDAGMPMLAYINKSQLAAIRKTLYSVPRAPENNTNEPVLRLQQLRSKILIPADADHDPYIVAVLLAMAQAHFYHESSPPSFRDTTLQIITHDEGNSSSPNFVIYKAVVTATFLARFMFPNEAPKSPEAPRTGIDISYTPVSFWPLLGLRERLSKVLGRGIAGDSIYNDRNRIGLWDTLVKPPPPADSMSLKRRRAGRKERTEFAQAAPVSRNPSPEPSPLTSMASAQTRSNN